MKSSPFHALNSIDLALETQRLENERREFVSALLPLFDYVEQLCRGIDRLSASEIAGKSGALALLPELADAAAVRIGLIRFGAEGESTDPYRYEVVETVLRADKPHGTVAKVLQYGYLLEGAVLRGAKVVATVANVGLEEARAKTRAKERKEQKNE